MARGRGGIVKDVSPYLMPFPKTTIDIYFTHNLYGRTCR